MTLGQIAQTSQGPMVGDYISTSFSGASATTVFPVGVPPTTLPFDEAMYTPTSPLPVATLADATRGASSRGVVASTDGARTGAVRRR
jgi:hypothetical protein